VDEAALGDVGHRQIGDERRVLRVRRRVHQRPRFGLHVRVGELDALGRPGRARRVDQRQRVRRRDRAPRGIEVEAVGAEALDAGEPGLVVDHDDVRHDVERAGRSQVLDERALGDEDGRPRIFEQVGDRRTPSAWKPAASLRARSAASPHV
jgi:hypothetical protein